MAARPFNDAAGTVAQFEAVTLPFMGALYNKALRLTQRPADASDLVQETYLRAYRAFGTFAPGTNCKAWLFTILYSIFVNQYRHQQRQPATVSLEEIEQRFHHALAADNTDFAAGMPGDATSWDAPEVDEALARLPENYRVAVLLVDVEEFSYEEAAGILNCPVGTVRSRLYRARQLLFVELRAYAQRMGYLKEPAD